MSPLFLDYDLPPELIAQEPIEPRDAARLLVADRATQALRHRHFHDLPDLLRPGDLLVLNNTRVLQARLLGNRQATGGKWEGLFLRANSDGTWEMLCQTRGRLRAGETIVIEPDSKPDLSGAGQKESSRPTLTLTLLESLSQGRWRVQPSESGAPETILTRHGHVPLPPYIRKGQDREEDRQRYQTVYSAIPGAVAAPTAGLHFTPELFDRLKERGIGSTFVTLHVGLGTFRPIEGDDVTKHHMHTEWGEISQDAMQAIANCKANGGRIVAVGTTSVRVLETAARHGPLQPWRGDTDLFIYPPFTFRAADALITNFHLPRTTLLLLVGAFAGVELLQRAYAAAVAERYRFFTYGDAMVVV